MKHKRTILFSDYALTPPSAEQKRKSIKQAMRLAGYVPHGHTLLPQLKTQLAYVGLWFWLGIAAVLGALLYFSWQIGVQASAPEQHLFPTLVLFSITGPLLASLSAPVLARSYSHNMWELEEACYHNLPRLTALRLMICTLAALPVLLVLAVSGLSTTGVLLGVATLIAPFLLANGVNYLILGRLRGNSGSLCCIGACAVLAIVCSYPFWGISQLTLLTQNQIGVPVLLLTVLGCALLFAMAAKRYIRTAPAER